MNSWTITNLPLKPHAPEILASTEDARAIALLIPAGESLDDHQVHERAWVTVLDGEVEIATATGESISGAGACSSNSLPMSATPYTPAPTPDSCYCSPHGQGPATPERWPWTKRRPPGTTPPSTDRKVSAG
jgi:hypothetical protein